MTNYQKMPSTEKSVTEMTNLTNSNRILSSTDQSDFDLPIEKDIPITQDLNISNEFSHPNKKIIPIKATRKGNMIMFCYNKDGDPWFVIGPHWPFSLCILIFVNFVNFFFYYFLNNSMFDSIKYIGLTIMCLHSLIYLIIFLKNPGIPNKELWIENYFKNKSDINSTSYKICNICKIIMRTNESTKHCEECNMCIIGREYHCSWISKCVSKGNKKLYYGFLGMTGALILYYLVALISLFFSKASSLDI